MRPCAGAYAERLRTMTFHTRKYIEAERPEGAWLWLGTHFHVLAAASPSLRAPLRKLAIVRARFRGVQKRHTSRVKIFRGGVRGRLEWRRVSTVSPPGARIDTAHGRVKGGKVP